MLCAYNSQGEIECREHQVQSSEIAKKPETVITPPYDSYYVDWERYDRSVNAHAMPLIASHTLLREDDKMLSNHNNAIASVDWKTVDYDPKSLK